MTAIEHNAIPIYFETKKLSPTDFKGARIKATCPMYLDKKASVVIPYDHALKPRENHYKAAEALLNKITNKNSIKYKYSGNMLITNSGYIFLFDYNSEN